MRLAIPFSFTVAMASLAMAQSAPPAATPPPPPAATSMVAAPAPPPVPTSQTTPAQPVTTPNPPATTSPAQQPTAVPTFAYYPMTAAYTACKTQPVYWQLRNENAAEFVVSMYVYNEGVDQNTSPATGTSSTPATSSTPPQQTSAAGGPAAVTLAAQSPPSKIVTNQAAQTGIAQVPPAQALVSSQLNALTPEERDASHLHLVERAVQNINVTIAHNQPANVALQWLVNVPPGRYRIMAVVNDTFGTRGISQVLTVVNGTTDTCYAALLGAGSSHPSSQATAGGSSPTTSPGTSVAGSEGSKTSGISGGAIAGIVIGVLAGVAILLGLLFFCLRKRRQSSPKNWERGGREVGQSTSPGTRESFGHTLAHGMNALGFGSVPEHSASLGSDEGGYEKHHGHPVAMELPQTPTRDRMGSAQSNATSENPFETAPSTPIDEKGHQRHYELPDDHHSELPYSAAGIAGAATAAAGFTHNRRNDDSTTSSGSNSQRQITSGSTTSMVSGAAAPGSQSEQHLQSAHLATGGSSDAFSTVPSTPLTSDGPENGTPNPPSSFQQSHGSSPTRTVERKTSTRRKPVPRLSQEEEMEMNGTLSDGHGSHGSLGGGSSENHATGFSRLPHMPPQLDIGGVSGGPAGDEFGLNAALAGIGGGSKRTSQAKPTYQLMPDPPLRTD